MKVDLPTWTVQMRKTRWRWLRTPVALALIVGGFLGFLPVLGFWMLPLGLALLASDYPPARRALGWLRKTLGAAPASDLRDDEDKKDRGDDCRRPEDGR